MSRCSRRPGRPDSLSGGTANTLAPDTLSDLREGACFNDARVQIEHADRASPDALR